MKNRMIIFLLAILGIMIPSFGMSPEQDASAAYEKGDYTRAIEIYNQLLSEKGSSSELYANLGNAYMKGGDWGRAMVSYERSLILDPSNSQVRNNRKYLLSKIEDSNKANAQGKKIQTVPDEEGFFTRFSKSVVYSHGTNTWSVWGAVCFVLFCGCVALYAFRRDVLIRKVGFFGGFTMLGFTFVFLIFAFASARGLTVRDRGVITGFKVSLMSEPREGSKSVGIPLSRGTIVNVEGDASEENGMENGENSEETAKKSLEGANWYKVRFNSEIEGWIRSGEIEVI